MSAISREIKRNGGRRQHRASDAGQAAWDRAHRPKRCKLANNAFLCCTIANKLTLHWSPQQIAGW
jgi:IS30 family transposase